MRRVLPQILFALPLLAAVFLTNWFVDPAHLRDPDAYQRGVADMLLQGKAVTNVSNDDTSAVLEYSIRGQTSAPDVLLLGTSKSKVIGSDFFPGRTFYNAALSGSGLADLLVIYNMYEQRGFVPKEVILEVNPWLLTAGRNSQVPRFDAQSGAVERGLLKGEPVELPNLPKKTSPSTRVYLRMFTPDYFQSSSLALLNMLVNGNNGQIREFHAGDTPLGTTYFPDGSIIVPDQLLANLGTERPAADALKYGWDPPGGIPAQIDPHQRKVLEAFVQHLAASGVKVTFYIPPYHPISYQLMMDSPNKIVVDIQSYFEELAQAHGFAVIGSYNPADVGVTAADFYDVTHITADAIRRIFEEAR
jgi:hypothetical protein